MRHTIPCLVSVALALLVAHPFRAAAQSVDLTVNQAGLSIGDSRDVRGVRLNFRDRRLERVDGVNATVWFPHEPARGRVRGVALGLPATGGHRIEGIGAAVVGISASGSLRGLHVAGLGVGAGDAVEGITIGGLGVGTGGRVRGLTVGGIGVGSGGGVTGITVGGIGVGSGGHVRGLTVAGVGVGGGGSTTGISIAGIGIGTGGDVHGISLAGIGVGSGGDVTGLTIAGIGIGAGGTLRGLAVGGVGVGAPTMRAITVALAAGGTDVQGVVVAPVYFRVDSDDGRARVRGLSVSAFNHVKGEQLGLSLGLFNYARVLNGVQLGVLNYAANNPPGLRLLPLLNRRW